MKCTKEQKRSRKKPLIHETQPQPVSSPNLKYDFLSKQPDKKLLQLLRAQQIDMVIQNIQSFFKDLNGKNRVSKQKGLYKKMMFLVGTPGTGKTASIKFILDQLTNNSVKDHKHIKKVQILSLNGNVTKKAEQIVKQTTKMIKKQSIKQIKGKYQSHDFHPKSSHVVNIINIQEVDEVMKANSQSGMINLIDIFQEVYQVHTKVEQSEEKKQKKQPNEQIHIFLLIGAANTINIQKIFDKKVPYAKYLKIIFTPYNQEALCKIMSQRILKVRQRMDIAMQIQDKLVRYIVTKLSENKRDDTRNIIQLVKQLVVYAERKPQTLVLKGDQAVLEVNLDLLHSITKIKNMLINSSVELVKKLNLKQHLILFILYSYIKNTEALQMPYMEVVQEYKKLQRSMGVTSYQDVTTAINELQTYNCLKIRSNTKNKASSSKQKSKSKVSVVLNMSLHDVEGALSCNPALAAYFK